MTTETEFETLRPYLTRLAYSQLGSVAEAEDVVQDAWLRLQRIDREATRDLRAWLATTVGRLSLDALRSARMRREQYVGEWLPEPVVDAPDPADRVTLDESVSHALLVVLEALSPAERTAFVLLDPDVVMRSDGGGRVTAARKPIVGADRVLRTALALARTGLVSSRTVFADINGSPGLVAEDPSGVLNVTVFTVDGGRITAIDVIRNPDKLVHVRRIP
jgi:RNA polymerase sigma factor (sigma-70 family)